MTTLRAHFDGKVLIPDQPVDLPTNCTLELQVRAFDSNDATTPATPSLRFGTHPLSGFPVFRVPPGTKTIALDDVQRADEDEL